ncbi:MAG: hypothetical protein ACI9OJ_004662 [Myxococcota bacterium]|jgi:hypothetical protein
MTALIVVLTAGLALGCGSTEAETIDENQVGQGSGKEDCPNCDPNGANAFDQAELDARWYRAGDKWTVAFQFRNNGEMAREDFLLPTQRDEWVQSGLFLFQYQALRGIEASPETSNRPAVEIAVTQVDPTQVGLDALGYFESERLDRHEHKLHFRMNDLTDAIDVTYFGRRYPNGKTVKASSKSELALNSSIFPVNVPRLLAGAKTVVAPSLPADLAKVADAVVPGWNDRSYKRFDFRNGDVVYWAKGTLWPFYVENSQGRGLLLDGQAN